MREKFANTFCELANEDKRLALLAADISPAVPAMLRFAENFPERFLNVGIAEQLMVGMAAGMALRGMRPFVYTIATFALYRPFEFIRDDLCYQNLPVTVVGAAGGVTYSTLGSTHHAMEDIAVATAIPNLTVLAPCDPLETAEVTRWCAQLSQGPVYLRIGKQGEKNYTDQSVEPFVPGKLRYVCRGQDICMIVYGSIIKLAFDLKDSRFQNQSVSIVSCHMIKPLDEEGLYHLFKTHKKVIVLEEHVPHGGLGSRVTVLAWKYKFEGELRCFSLQDKFIHFFGEYQELLDQHHLSAHYIACQA